MESEERIRSLSVDEYCGISRENSRYRKQDYFKWISRQAGSLSSSLLAWLEEIHDRHSKIVIGIFRPSQVGLSQPQLSVSRQSVSFAVIEDCNDDSVEEIQRSRAIATERAQIGNRNGMQSVAVAG